VGRRSAKTGERKYRGEVDELGSGGSPCCRPFFPIRNSCTRNIAGTLTRSCRRKRRRGERRDEEMGEREKERRIERIRNEGEKCASPAKRREGGGEGTRDKRRWRRQLRDPRSRRHGCFLSIVPFCLTMLPVSPVAIYFFNIHETCQRGILQVFGTSCRFNYQ
jgi:hypothetical protein